MDISIIFLLLGNAMTKLQNQIPSDAVRELSDRINRNRENIIGGYSSENQVDMIAQFVAPIEEKLAKMESKHGQVDADEVEPYENCECCGNFHRMEEKNDSLKIHADMLSASLHESMRQLNERDAKIETLRDALAGARFVFEKFKGEQNPSDFDSDIERINEALTRTAPISEDKYP